MKLVIVGGGFRCGGPGCFVCPVRCRSGTRRRGVERPERRVLRRGGRRA